MRSSSTFVIEPVRKIARIAIEEDSISTNKSEIILQMNKKKKEMVRKTSLKV